MITILCPECQKPIELDSDLKIGQQTTCQLCDTELIVTWLFPISLDYLENQDANFALPRYKH